MSASGSAGSQTCVECGQSVPGRPKFCFECGTKFDYDTEVIMVHESPQKGSPSSKKKRPQEADDHSHQELTKTYRGPGDREQDGYVVLVEPRENEGNEGKKRKKKFKPKSGVSSISSPKVKFIFHVLIPTYAWVDWNDQCSVHVRFGHPELGEWMRSHGTFKKLRDCNGVLEFEGHVELDCKALKSPECVAYLYYVDSSNYETQSEFLYGLPHELGYQKNRLLKIPKNVDKDVWYDQYDSMAYPNVTYKTVIVDRPVDSIIQQTKDSELEIPNHEFMQADALAIYLDDCKTKLRSLKLSTCYNVEDATKKIFEIFNFLNKPTLCGSEEQHRGLYRRTWPCKNLIRALGDSILEIMDVLYEIDTKMHPAQNGRKMASAITLMCFFNETKKVDEITTENIKALLSMLRLQPDVDNQKCSDWDILNELIPNSFRKAASDSVLAFIKHLSKDDFLKPEWLFAIPVVHFLCGNSPFQSVEYDPHGIPWVDKIIGLATVRTSTKGKTLEGVIEALFEDLEPFFTLDPPLLYGFMYICPQKDLPRLLRKVFPYISISFVASQLQNNKGTSEQAGEATAEITIITNTFMEYCKEDNYPYQMWRATFSASVYLFQEALSTHKGNTEVYINLLNHITRLVLACYRKIYSMKNIEMELLHETTPVLITSLTKYVDKVFGAAFGSSKWFQSRDQGISEIKFWNSIISPSYENDEILHNWQTKVISKIVESRIQKLKLENRIILFRAVDSIPDCNSIITNIFMEAIMEKINSMSSGDVENLISSSPLQGKNVGKIIEKIMDEHCRNESVTFKDLITWPMWQTFIKLYNSEESHYVNFISLKCIELFAKAKTMLDHVCARVKSGNITLQELLIMKDEKDNVYKLLVANKEEVKCVKDALEQRFRECSAFYKRIEHLGQLCQNVNVPVEGLDQLRDEINNSNHNKMPINTLCKVEEGNIFFLSLKSAFPLDEIALKYDIMFRRNSTDIACAIWTFHMDNSAKLIARQEHTQLTIENIKTDIWDPTFEECKALLGSLHDRSIKLDDVDRYFSSVKDRDIHHMLLRFCSGVSECIGSGSHRADSEWIRTSVNLMEEYWSLLKLADAAKTVMTLKEKLGLSGDFTPIKTIADKVVQSVGNRTLNCIDESYIVAGGFLKELGDSNKLDCLKKFSESLKIVEWAQHQTKDVKDLHTFVMVALHTAAGEGDYANDRLSRLKIVGSGYGPLIYDLQSDPSFNNFKICCEKVWEALEQTPILPDFLKYCDDDIEWYKSVKGTQGSVEVTSYGQMDNIFEYGCYKVGLKRPITCKSCSDVISLRLSEDEKCLTKTTYNLEELRDLESKLVLITGSNAENRKKVELFVNTLHSVCRIAEVLITLQQAGNVKYIGWIYQVPCSSSDEIISRLQAQAQVMEKELSEWNDNVFNARQKFCELNYFTTIQLVTLRRELGVLNDPLSACEILPSVLVLLQSISSEVNSKNVREVVQNVVSPFSGINKMIPSSSDDTENVSFPNDKDPVYDEKISCSNDNPTLSEDELTPEQEEIMIYIIAKISCSKLLVLKAFEECKGKDMNKFRYLKWCNDHTDSYKFSEDEESNSDEDDVMPADDIEPENSPPGFSYLLAPESQKSRSNIILSLNGSSKHQQADSKTSPVPYEQLLGDYNEGNQPFEMNWKRGEDPVIFSAAEAESRYLNLEQLGKVLFYLSGVLKAEVSECRNYYIGTFKYGQPNLLVVAPDQVLRTTLYVYMENYYQPLPTLEEVLVCHHSTTAEEIELFWMKAISDKRHRRIFCLIHAEKLTYQVSDLALRSLSKHSQGKKEYRIVIICSNEDEEKSFLISKLHLYKRQFVPQTDIQEFKNYLTIHFTKQSNKSMTLRHEAETLASVVDQENSSVRVVCSDRSGMGKSLYIQRLANNLKRKHPSSDVVHVTIPLHGPVVTPDTVLELFQDHYKNPNCCIYHIDIAPNNLKDVDTILFSLLILGGLIDSQGKVWRCHPNQFYAIEVTIPNEKNLQDVNGIPESLTLSLLHLLPTVTCLSPMKSLDFLQASKKDYKLVLMDDQEFRSDSYQRAYQYIKLHSTVQPAKKKNTPTLETFTFRGKLEGSPQECLQLLMKHCGVKDPSWSEIHHFVNFLNHQLLSCEMSYFLDPKLVGDTMDGLKTFIIKFMIRMSRDFSTSSLCGEVAMEMREAIEVEDNVDIYQINERRSWEQNPHPYIFFNEDRISLTFVGFTVSSSGDLLNSTKDEVIEENIMTATLYRGLQHNKVNFDDSREWSRAVMIEKLSTVMGIKSSEEYHDPDETYVLTKDNVTKILAILMRFRCGIPVVIMGETGCGKTRLIRYMCDLAKQGSKSKNLFILKIHGGTTEEDISKFIAKAESESEENNDTNTVVFFDEANTTDAIGLIKEIMCDHRINGKTVSSNLKFIAACNPYRKHTKKMIDRLEKAGLGFFVKATETHQTLGKIPLRQLVYRVLDLPPSMRPLVYDYGQLNTEAENKYIEKMVSDYISNNDQLLDLNLPIATPIINILTWSQTYMRKTKDECSFVSLRDVERAMIVFEYMYGMMDVFGPLMDECARKEQIITPKHKLEYESPGAIARALVLSLSICYHARLQNRHVYENGVAKHFTGPVKLPGGSQQFRDEIRWCQEVLLDHMQIGDNIARNAALRENVFMMAICVELRIPLFLVGKPGSSKSLAKSIINESMKGRNSSNSLLKKFKEVDIFSYQCSQLSTSESVIEVFTNASKFQVNRDIDSYVAVVVLDEVGLAEDSPNLPLKALHPLLEDGTDGAKSDYAAVVIDRRERVSFIGISNWALDPAKMNRGVMVTRGSPSEEELVFSAKGICSNRENDPVRSKLESFFEPLAKAYISICNKQKREFFGLRDFYSLIKMIYYMCEKTNVSLTWAQLEHAIKRNFGGLESDNLDAYEEFKNRIQMNRDPPDLTNIANELHCIVKPDCTRLGLIRTCLSSQEQTWHGENRYVLFLTENYAALEILKNPKNYLGDVINFNQSSDQSVSAIQPFVLFGSSFPKDKEYTQVCQNINQIKICMETGRTVILLNLENLYESLYDVLNQYYIYHADSRYVDLGLQSHRVKCRVHNDFKLILIAERDTVYDKFPTPLINRLEKHYVLTSHILNDWQGNVMVKFEQWINGFSDEENSKFRKEDAFIGFQKDTPASVIFQATNFLGSACAAAKEGVNVKKGKWADIFKWSQLNPSDCTNVEDEQQKWEDAVVCLSKHLLLQIATPEAIVRLEHTVLAEDKSEVEYTYFQRQCHGSIEEFLNHHIHDTCWESGVLMQVTTHSHLLSQGELKCVADTIKINVSSFFLEEFDTELDFFNKVGLKFKLSEDRVLENNLVIIQCDSSHVKADLIACARYRIYDLRAKADTKLTTHVLFIIHLPRHVTNNSFVGFQGDPWISFHIDELRPATDNGVSVGDAIRLSISELFRGRSCKKISAATDGDECDSDLECLQNDTSSHCGDVSSLESSEEVVSPEDIKPILISSPCYSRLHGCIQAAVSKLKDVTHKRCARRVAKLVSLIPKESPHEEIESTSVQFCDILVHHIYKVLQEHDQLREDQKEWVINEAKNPKSLQHGGTFRNVLSRKVDEIVIPIFSKIISSIDRNFNLDLIDSKEYSSPLSQFWLIVFCDSSIMQFKYVDMVTPQDNVPGLSARKAGEDYTCELPFSWLIYEAVESQWDNAKTSAGTESKIQLHKQLHASLEHTSVYDVLTKVDDSNFRDFFHRYLHDFVRLVHRCNHNDELQYKLIENALDALVDENEFNTTNMSLVQRISALHVVHHRSQSQILWFGQLVAHSPGIMVLLKRDDIRDQEEMILHYCAVEKALDSLARPLDEGFPDDGLSPWLNDIHSCQNAITSILNLNVNEGLQKKWLGCKQKWDAMEVLKLFLEHVLLKHNFKESVGYLNRLSFKLDFNADFSRATTLNLIRSHLETTEKEVKQKKFIKGKDFPVFKRHCQDYFMEVVSTLCFGSYRQPEPALIKMLMQMMFTEERRRLLIPSTSGIMTNSVPEIKSSLLQLLLDVNSETVKEFLEEYFTRSKNTLVGGKGIESLCLLCIQCFEDALFKFHSSKDPKTKWQSCIEILTDSHRTLRKYKSNPAITISYLEAVAGAKFAILEVAELFYYEFCNEPKEKPDHSPDSQETMKMLIDTAKKICSDTVINTTVINTSFFSSTEDTDVLGPAVYLLKLLVRHFSFPCLKQASEKHLWIVPESLRTSNLEKIMDPFVIYDNTFGYSQLKEKITDVLHHGKRLEKLLNISKDFLVKKLVTLLLAIYQTITLGYSFPKRSVDSHLLQSFKDLLLGMTHLPPLMLRVANLLLNNELGAPLTQMRIRPGLSAECKLLGAIVVHTATALSSSHRQSFFQPLINMLSKPAALKNTYFPTMVDDSIVNIPEAEISERLYACPKGHRYTVGGCGLPAEKKRCFECGAKIGGNYRLRSDNTKVDNKDCTSTGHALGDAKLRRNTPGPERNLSPTAICIVRAIMHSALLFCSCHFQDMSAELAELVKPPVKHDLLPQFFWMHLKKDIEHLSRVTGRGMEESALIIHFVLHDILLTPPSDQVKTVSLGSQTSRKDWETYFNDAYIKPIVTTLNARLDEAMEIVSNDVTQGQDKLFRIVYEKNKVKKKILEPHLWSYRQRISLEHLGQTFQDANLKDNCPILHEFISVEPGLRATQYLPDIVKLQHSFYDNFHHCLDRKEAETKTLGEFCDDLRKKMASNVCDEYQDRLDSLKKAWTLVGQNLKNHGRLRLEEEHCIPAITRETPLEYLIPTMSGAGALTSSLVHYLITIHNQFIDKCYNIAQESLSDWFCQNIPITHINHCHLLDYEHQIISVVLSHCCYSLRVGEAHRVTYDYQALEKHILDKFVYGKPRIIPETLQVVYRKDIYTTMYFDAVRDQVSPQERLGLEERKAILKELRTPDRLRENLDVVDIVLGFLSSGGAKAEKPLGDYIDKVLKMKQRSFSVQARKCFLRHIISLWETLSVELSRLIWLQDQEPFDSLDEKCLVELRVEDGDNQKDELDKCLRRFNLDRMLGGLYEFIETFVRISEESNLKWPLRNVLEQDQFQHLDMEDHFSAEFPISITLDQTVAVWKHIVHYQKELKQE